MGKEVVNLSVYEDDGIIKVYNKVGDAVSIISVIVVMSKRLS